MESTCRAPERSGPALVRWPEADAVRRDRALAGLPTLLVVPRGAPVPPTGPCEDWVWSDADEQEVAGRLLRLGGASGIGEGTVATKPVVLPPGLSADQHRVAAHLAVAVGRLVPRADLAVMELDAVIEALALRLDAGDEVVVAVGQAGFVLVATGVEAS